MKKLTKFLSSSRLYFVLSVVLYFVVVVGLPVWFLAKPAKKLFLRMTTIRAENLEQIKISPKENTSKKKI